MIITDYKRNQSENHSKSQKLYLTKTEFFCFIFILLQSLFTNESETIPFFFEDINLQIMYENMLFIYA